MLMYFNIDIRLEFNELKNILRYFQDFVFKLINNKLKYIISIIYVLYNNYKVVQFFCYQKFRRRKEEVIEIIVEKMMIMNIIDLVKL